jgi:stage V sporulation protein AA
MASGVDGKGEILYLKIERSILKYEPKITLNDVGSLECSNDVILAHLKTLPIYNFRHPGNIACTATKLVEEIHKIYPKLQVQTIGEPDVLLEYRSAPPTKAWQIAKLVIISMLLFFGAFFTIMAFHNDIGITDVFDKFYFQVAGTEKPKVSALEISYSLGLVVGITAFYNHFGMKKLTHDPTPVQVELRKYEKDVDTAIMENASRRKENLDVS